MLPIYCFLVLRYILAEALLFVAECDLTRMSVVYTETVDEVILNQRGSAWVKAKLVRLWSEIWKFKIKELKRNLRCTAHLAYSR